MHVSFEDFKKLDIRVARVIKAEDHPNADKLYLVTVDLGPDAEGKTVVKTLVAGIRAHYSKEELIGKFLVVAANLEPAVIRGIASEGMLLAASDKDKQHLVVLTVDKPVAPGSKVS